MYFCGYLVGLEGLDQQSALAGQALNQLILLQQRQPRATHAAESHGSRRCSIALLNNTGPVGLALFGPRSCELREDLFLQHCHIMRLQDGGDLLHPNTLTTLTGCLAAPGGLIFRSSFQRARRDS